MSFEELMAADQSDAEIQYQIGLCYLNGDGIEQDKDAAEEWFRMSADQGYEAACKELGLKNTVETKALPAEDKTEYTESELGDLCFKAENGDEQAQFILGKLWAFNDEYANDAVRYLKLAQQNGYAEASEILAEIMINNGINNRKQAEEYIMYLENAADCDNSRAIDSLAHCYLNGFYVDRNLEQAESYAVRAASLGQSDSAFELAFAYYYGDGEVQTSKAKALALLEKLKQCGITGTDERFAEEKNRREEKALKDAEEARLWQEHEAERIKKEQEEAEERARIEKEKAEEEARLKEEKARIEKAEAEERARIAKEKAEKEALIAKEKALKEAEERRAEQAKDNAIEAEKLKIKREQEDLNHRKAEDEISALEAQRKIEEAKGKRIKTFLILIAIVCLVVSFSYKVFVNAREKAIESKAVAAREKLSLEEAERESALRAKEEEEAAKKKAIEEEEAARKKAEQEAFEATLVEMDPFEDLALEFNGVAPYATLSIYNNSMNEFMQTLSYTASKTDNISAGDIITITASTNGSEAKDYGYKLKLMQKAYIVKTSDLSSYVSSVDQIPSEYMHTIYEHCKEIVEADAAKHNQNWQFALAAVKEGLSFSNNFNYSLVTSTASEQYFMVQKPGYDGNPKNLLRFLFTLSCDVDYRNEIHPGTVYYSATLSDITIDAQGQVQADLSAATCSKYYGDYGVIYADYITSPKSTYVVTKLE